jgi:hypothetical protein
MSKFFIALSAGIIAATVVSGAMTLSSPAAAATMSDADKAAAKAATATCKAQVKEQAKFTDMSWWARHKAVQKCVKEILAHR